MAGGGDHWQPALLDLRYRRSHQSGARTHDDKISGSGKRKGVVAKTLGKTFVAVFQLQCSRKSHSFAVSKLMKNQFANEVLLHGYGLVDTGAVRTVIPTEVVKRLGVGIRGQRVAEYADGR